LILVKVWNPSHWTLSEIYEIYVPKVSTLDLFASVLAARLPIERKHLKCAKINSSWNFSRVQLPFEQWVSLDGSTDYFSAAPFYVSTDGILFIVKDGSLPEREMTADERELYRSDDFEANTFAASSSKPKGKNGPKEKGIKIKVKGTSPKAED
jgi:hypothetical protein